MLVVTVVGVVGEEDVGCGEGKYPELLGPVFGAAEAPRAQRRCGTRATLPP